MDPRDIGHLLRRYRPPDGVPAVLHATGCLGLHQSLVARLLDVKPQAVDGWSRGKGRFPPTRQFALIHMVTTLAHGWMNGEARPDITHFRRTEIACRAAQAWCELAMEELADTCGGEIPAEVLTRGAEGGRLMAALIDKDVEIDETERQIAETEQRIAESKRRLARLAERKRGKRRSWRGRAASSCRCGAA